jgi:UDP-N-acetylmuramyl pentapeptide phosphotransferase/UDP-N-acetylglucosamine-1-phosphate transferase
MQAILPLLAVVVGAGLIAYFGTGVLIPILRRTAMLDRPNERSSHIVPTPRGGGIAVVAAILLGWLALIGIAPVSHRLFAVMAGALLLAVVSGLDDRRSLPALPRLLAQIVAVALGMVALAPLGPVFQDRLPPVLDIMAATLLWVWFVNLFNFMDGIDGIDGSEAAAIALGLVAFATFGVGSAPVFATLAATIGAAALAFLMWNWSPAKIFLGDAGSIPLGYLLGFLLLAEAARGFWKVALILPLYFLADATITLLRRLARGERVWQAHREHFYQQAVQRGLGHADVVKRVIAADVVLIGAGWAAENGWAVPGLAVAVITVAVLLADLAGWGQRRRPA